MRVSVGPLWFCRADFSDGKVQKLGVISTRLGVLVRLGFIALVSVMVTVQKLDAREHVSKTPRLRNGLPVFCLKSGVPLTSCLHCTVRLARAQAVTSRILETEIHVENVVFVIGRRRFRYVWPFEGLGTSSLYHGPNICIDLACPCRPSEQVCTNAPKTQNWAPIYSQIRETSVRRSQYTNSCCTLKKLGPSGAQHTAVSAQAS